MATPTTPAPASKPGAPRPGAVAPGGPGPTGAGLNLNINPLKLVRQHLFLLIGAVFVGGVLGVGSHFALLRTYPLYTSEALFECTAALTSAESSVTMVGPGGAPELERFIATQAAIMISDGILLKAANDPRVRNETDWAKAFVVGGRYDPTSAKLDLEEIASARPQRDTAFASLKVTAGKADDAATLCSAVVRAYLDHVRNETGRTTQDTLEVLTRQLNSIQEERRLLRQQMERIFDDGLPGLDDRGTIEAQMIAELMPRLAESRQELDILRQQLTEYDAQQNAPGGTTYPEIVRQMVDGNPIINGFKQRIAAMKATRRAAMQAFGESHRDVQRLDREIKGVEDEMETQRQSLMSTTFAGVIETTRLQISSLEATANETLATLEESQVTIAGINRKIEEYTNLAAEEVRLAEQEERTKASIANQRALANRAAASRVSLYQNPEPPQEPSFPQLIIMVPAVMFLTLGLVVGVIVLREVLEQRVRGPADAALIPRLRILGVIPDVSEDPTRVKRFETAVRDRPMGAVSESIRQMRGLLQKRLAERGHRTLLILSGAPGSGASAVVANLAASLGSCEHRVLIIDANLRRPRQHEIFDRPASPGLSEVLAGTVPFEQATQPSVAPGVDLLPAGGAVAAGFERLTTDAMGAVLARAKERYDVTLIDASPAIVSSDSYALANRCDASVLVVRAYREKRGLIARVRGNLEESRSDFLGLIINGVRSAAGGYFGRNMRVMHQYNNGQAALDAEDSEPGGKKEKREKKRRKQEAGVAEVGAPSSASGAGDVITLD